MNKFRHFSLGVTFLLLSGASIPTVSAAQNDTLRKKVAQLTNQLVRLPPERAAPARVSQLVLKLSGLAPQFANSYFRWGISKLPYQDYNGNQNRLAKETIALVKASTLASRQMTKIIFQIQMAVKQSTVPPPYQA